MDQSWPDVNKAKGNSSHSSHGRETTNRQEGYLAPRALVLVLTGLLSLCCVINQRGGETDRGSEAVLL